MGFHRVEAHTALPRYIAKMLKKKNHATCSIEVNRLKRHDATFPKSTGLQISIWERAKNIGTGEADSKNTWKVIL